MTRTKLLLLLLALGSGPATAQEEKPASAPRSHKVLPVREGADARAGAVPPAEKGSGKAGSAKAGSTKVGKKAAAQPPKAGTPDAAGRRSRLAEYLPSLEVYPEDLEDPDKKPATKLGEYLRNLEPSDTEEPLPPVFPPFVWDIPRPLDIADVPGVMMADGIPVRMKAVRSADRLEFVLQYLVDRFEAAGLYVPPGEHQPQMLREPQITALDVDRLISYTAILQPNPDNTTTVLLGEADLSQGRRTQSAVAPVFPGAQGVISSDLEVARSLSYSVRGKAEEVESFYRKELGRAGFQEVEPRLYRAGREELQLLLTPAPDGQLSVVVLRRTAGPEAAPPHTD